MSTITELTGVLTKSSLNNEVLLLQPLNNTTITRENEATYGLMALLAGYSWSILEQYMSNNYDPFSNIYLHTGTLSGSENMIEGNGQIDIGFVYNSSLVDLNTDTFVVSNFAIPTHADAVNLHAADITLS